MVEIAIDERGLEEPGEAKEDQDHELNSSDCFRSEDDSSCPCRL